MYRFRIMNTPIIVTSEIGKGNKIEIVMLIPKEIANQTN